MQTQVNIQRQTQTQVQTQHLSPLQLQVMRLLEVPLAELEQKVQMELANNPSLEVSSYDDGYDDAPYAAESPATDTEGMDEMMQDEQERREDALSDALNSYGSDDRMEDTTFSDDTIPNYNTEERHFENGNTTSFIETLLEQMNMEELNDEEKQIMEYLIGSLDDDGLLRKDLRTITDELAIFNYLYVDEQQVEDVLLRLQEFDPAGIGARSLQECLRIQVERMKATPLTMQMFTVINDYCDEMMANHWDVIQRKMKLTPSQTDLLRSEIRHQLNPKPGASFGETQGRTLDQITPDVIISIDYDDNISFELNNGRIPQLHIVRDDEQMLASLNATSPNSDAAKFLQHNISSANLFIEAMRQRNDTIVRTMTAIIHLQRRFLLSGDEADLRPMVLRDIERETGLDASTVSRVSRSKYVQTQWGTFPIRHFFSEAYTTKDGETMSNRAIKQTLREVIDKEDKKHPLSDEKIVKIMAEHGQPIARRTIAKYREQLGIPSAKYRKR